MEKDKIFRGGGLLAQDANTTATVIYLAKVWDPSTSTWIRGDNISLNDTIAIFDTSSPFEGAHDKACVIGLDAGYSSYAVQLLLGKTDCTGGYTGLTHNYSSSVDQATHQWTFATGTRSAGVGVISGGCDLASNQINATNSCFYDADMRDIEQPYDDAYVEFVGQRNGAGAMPYLPPSFFSGYQMSTGGICTAPVTERIPGYDFAPMYRLAWLWFKNHGAPNYNWLCGAGQTSPLDGCTIGCSDEYAMPQYLGLTMAASQESFVFSGHHELYCTYTPNGPRQNTNHELGHNFFLNPTATDAGHDTRCQWTVDGSALCSSSATVCADRDTACLMNPIREFWANQHRFDRFDLFCGNSGCPNGTSGCCNDGVPGCTIPGNGSIRQLNDLVQGVTP